MARKTTMDIEAISEAELRQKWINVNALSLSSGYTRASIYKWIKQGKITARTLYGMVLVPEGTKLPPERVSKNASAPISNHSESSKGV